MPDDNIPTLDIEEMPTIDLGETAPEVPVVAQTPQERIKQAIDSGQPTIGVPPSGIAQTLRDFESDFRYGGGSTMAGRLLQKLGAQGINVGAQASAGDYMGSPILGPTHMAQGVAEKSPLKVAGGALETATIPSTFMGLGAAEAVTPTSVLARAGSRLGEFEAATGHLPVNVARSGEVALQAKRLADEGALTLPKVFRRFLDRATGPNQPPMTIGELRNLVSTASSLSAKELSSMPPAGAAKMKRMLGMFTNELHGDIADASGQASNYYQALKAYSNAKGYSSVAEGLKDFVVRELKYATGGAAAGAGFYGAKRAIDSTGGK